LTCLAQLHIVTVQTVREELRFLENPAYAYAVGRVRALENQLLDRQRYERLVRSASTAEFLAGLADTVYADAAAEGGSAGFAAGLARAEGRNREFLAAYAADPWLLALYEVPAEFLDRRQAARGRPSAAGGQPAISNLESPAALDLALDKLEQQELLNRLAPSHYLTRYLALRADTLNLLALLRTQRTGVREGARDEGQGGHGGRGTRDEGVPSPGRSLAATLLLGGSVAEKDWLALVAADAAEIQRRFRYTPLEPLAEEISNLKSPILNLKSPMDRAARLAREALLCHLARARFAVLGHEPLAGFYLMRENEIANLRRLYAAKAAGRPADRCAELVALAA